MAKAKMAAQSPDAKPERFIRIIQQGRGPGDNFDAFQAEMIEVVGDAVTHRQLLDKPNLFEYAYAQAADLIDPRNESPENKT